MADSLTTRLSERKKGSARTVVVVTLVIATLVVVGVGVALASGGSPTPIPPTPVPPTPVPPTPVPPTPPAPVPPTPKPSPDPKKPPNPPAPEPDIPDPAPDPDPPAPLPRADPRRPEVQPDRQLGRHPDADAHRARVHRARLAIPGLARALGVKAWQTFRAKQAFVDTTAAAAIAAANPELCRYCVNANDGPSSKKLLDANIAQGWPMPVDYAGWAAASFGLFDILGAVAVHAGVHTDSKAWLPLPKMANAAEAMRRYDVQGFAASYIVRRLMFSTKYKVLVPGAKAPAATQDPKQTWGNIFSAYAAPDDFSKGTQASKDRKAQFLARAAEIGIDLAKADYPWPPDRTFSAPNWTAKKVWDRLQEFKGKTISNTASDPKGLPPAPDEQGLVTVGSSGLKALIRSQVQTTADVPLLVVLHGADADEKQLLGAIPKDLPVRVAFLRGAVQGANPNTWRFYDATHSSDPVVLVPRLDLAAQQVWTAITELALELPTSAVYVVGYSQGGSIAFDLAAKAIKPNKAAPWTGRLDGVLSISGFLPTANSPQETTPTKVWAIHGSNDTLIPIKSSDDVIAKFLWRAPAAELRTIPGGGHGIGSAQIGVIESTLKAMLA